MREIVRIRSKQTESLSLQISRKLDFGIVNYILNEGLFHVNFMIVTLYMLI